MKLAIADPPYLGRGAMLYGPNAVTFHATTTRPTTITPRCARPAGDSNPDAILWDDPETHRALVAQLVDEYEGWVVAMNPENLRHYLAWVDETVRVAAWVKPDAYPAGHVVRSWEPVLVKVPDRTRPREAQARDSLVARKQYRGAGGHKAFVGAKPPAWTRWVLDMLGYNPDEDTVDDLFGGSGAVSAEIAQGVLI